MPDSWEVLDGLSPIEGTTFAVHVHGRKAQVYEVKATVWNGEKPAFDVTMPRVAIDNRSAAAKASIDAATAAAKAEAIRRVESSEWQQGGHYFLSDKTRPGEPRTSANASPREGQAKTAPRKLSKKV